MMASPESFAMEYEGKSYKELLEIREELIRAIWGFERDVDHSGPGWELNPSPEVRYQMNLEYLAEICKMLSKQYTKEFIWKDE